MKKFRDFLNENVDYNSALKILDVKSGYTQDELKKAYKSHAIANHPDKGGDLEKMKLINLAYDVLSKAQSSTDSMASYREFKKEQDARKNELHEFCVESLKKHFDPEAFKMFFRGIFDQNFTTDIQFSTNQNKKYFTPSYASVYAEFANEDRSIVLKLKAEIYLEQFFSYNSGGSLGSDNAVNMYVTTSILYGTRSIKLTDRNWSTKNNYDVLSKPETIFPKDKLKAQVKKVDTKKLKFSRKDASLIFTSKLKARTHDAENYYVEIIPNIRIRFFRSVFMRVGIWNAWGIDVENRRDFKGIVPPLKTVSFPENEKTLLWIVKTVEDVRKHSKTIEEVATNWNHAAEWFTKHREDFYEN